VKGIMNLLAAVNLVTLSEEEQAQAQAEADAASVVEPAVPVVETAPEPAPVQYEAAAVAPGKSLDEIFREAGISPSPFPAERLLRLLDGLRAMDEATRKAAVRAMDDADENWNIDDPVLDAQRKINALEGFRQALAAQVSGRQEQAAADIAALKTAQERAVAEIKKQIAELEKLLEREMQKTAQQIAALEAEISALQGETDREDTRMQEEIARLREIPAQFGQHSKHQ